MVPEKSQGPARRRRLELERLEERIAPAGSIFVGISGGNLIITGDAEANVFEIETFGEGLLRVTPAPGTTIAGGGLPLIIDYVASGIKMSLGDGDDFVSLHGAIVAKNVQIDAGAGIDAVLIDSLSTIGGSLTVSDADVSEFAVASVAGNVKLTYTTDGEYAVFMSHAQIGGNFSIAIHGQDMLSNFDFDSSSIGGRLTVSNTTGTHGLGVATRLSLYETVVGGVKVKGGAGDYYFDFINSSTGPGPGAISLSYGVGDVTTLIDNSTINGSVSLKTAGGLPAIAYDTAFTLQNSSNIWGKLTITTFDSDDVVLLDDAYVSRGMNLNTGTGTSVVTINDSGMGIEKVGSKFIYSTSTILQSTSGWSFDDDTTTVSVTQSEFGSLNLNLRPQQSQVSFESVGSYRNLFVSGQGGDDALTFRHCIVMGSFAVKSAGGNDTLTFDEIEVRTGALSIDAGAGVDSVRMDTGTESLSSTYNGPVKIALGAGDDFLQLGNPLLNGNTGHYVKAVTLDGGPGGDEIFYLTNGNVFTVVPKVNLFENTH